MCMCIHIYILSTLLYYFIFLHYSSFFPVKNHAESFPAVFSLSYFLFLHTQMTGVIYYSSKEKQSQPSRQTLRESSELGDQK